MGLKNIQVDKICVFSHKAQYDNLLIKTLFSQQYYSIQKSLKIPKFTQFHILSLLSSQDRRKTEVQQTEIKVSVKKYGDMGKELILQTMIEIMVPAALYTNQ